MMFSTTLMSESFRASPRKVKSLEAIPGQVSSLSEQVSDQVSNHSRQVKVWSASQVSRQVQVKSQVKSQFFQDKSKPNSCPFGDTQPESQVTGVLGKVQVISQVFIHKLKVKMLVWTLAINVISTVHLNIFLSMLCLKYLSHSWDQLVLTWMQKLYFWLCKASLFLSKATLSLLL